MVEFSVAEFIGWVADALRLLGASKQGLTKSDILACLLRLGYHGDSMVTNVDLTLLLEMGRGAFIEKPGHVIWFQHQVVKEAVEYSLLGMIV